MRKKTRPACASVRDRLFPEVFEIRRGEATMTQAHRVCGWILLVLAFACFGEGFRNWEGIGGTGFFPMILGIIFTLLGTGFLIRKFAERGQSFPWPPRPGRLRLGLVITALFLFLLLTPYLGYPFTTVLFIASLLKTLGGIRWPYGLILGAVAALMTYVVFKTWLNMPLPMGMIGI
jgi:hypothetical protein